MKKFLITFLSVWALAVGFIGCSSGDGGSPSADSRALESASTDSSGTDSEADVILADATEEEVPVDLVNQYGTFPTGPN